jgi:hypothetical protein
VGWLVEANVSEKRAVSIFRAEYGDSTQKNIIRMACYLPVGPAVTPTQQNNLSFSNPEYCSAVL